MFLNSNKFKQVNVASPRPPGQPWLRILPTALHRPPGIPSDRAPVITSLQRSCGSWQLSKAAASGPSYPCLPFLFLDVHVFRRHLSASAWLRKGTKAASPLSRGPSLSCHYGMAAGPGVTCFCLHPHLTHTHSGQHAVLFLSLVFMF